MSSLVEKVEALSRIAGWPGETRLNPEAWLEQFDEADRPLAEALGLSLTIVPETQFLRHLSSGLNRLRTVVAERSSAPFCASWDAFVAQARFVLIEDKRESLANSASYLARLLRDDLGVDSARIIGSGHFTRQQFFTNAIQPVVFVEDMLATGDQFCEAMTRTVRIDSERTTSLSRLLTATSGAWMMLPLFATTWGIARVRSLYPSIALCSTVILSKRDSWRGGAFVAQNRALQQSVATFVERAHRELGLRTDPSMSYLGYKHQALTISFGHGTPDGTDPLLHSAASGYRPLLSRVAT